MKEFSPKGKQFLIINTHNMIEISVSAIKGGYRELFQTTPTAPRGIASMIRPDSGSPFAVGQEAYAISFQNAGFVCTKCKIIRDVLGAPPEPDPDDDSDDENNENGNSNDTENATENLSEATYLRTLPNNGAREYRLPSGATKRVYPGGAIRLTPPQTQ